MTVPATTRRAGPFNGNDSSTSFPFAFRVFSKDDIQAQHADATGVTTQLVLDSDFSVTLNADQDATPGGTVTYPISGDPLAEGEKLVLLGAVPYEQTTDLPSGGAYRASVVEDALDRTVMQVQQLSEELGRALTLPAVAAGADTTLPAPVPGNVVGWDQAGRGLQNYSALDLASAAAFADWRAETFTADGTRTQFVLAAAPGSVGNLDVAIDGVTQATPADWSLSGTTLTFTTAPPPGAVVFVRYGRAVPQTTAFSTELVSLPAGETTITLAATSYTAGSTNALIVANGVILTPGVDYTETSSTTFQLTSAFADAVEVLVLVGQLVSSGIAAGAVTVSSPGAGGRAVLLSDEISRGRVSVHRFAGVVGNGVNDDTAGLQAGIDFAQLTGLLLEFDPTKTYYTSAPLVWQHGRNATDTRSYSVRVAGNGCNILPNHNGDTFRIEPRCPDSDVGTGREIASIDFGGFFVNGFFITANTHTNARALTVGKTGFVVDSFTKSRIYDIAVQTFLQPPFLIEQARMLKCERLITRDDSGGMLLRVLRDGFVGDITLEDCEFDGNVTRRPLHIFAEASSAFAEARGIRVDNCVLYGSGARLESGANGKVDDIWFDNLACDGPDAPAGEPAVELYAHDGGTMAQVFVSHPYIVNYTGSAVIVRRGSGSSFKAVEVAGGYISQITAADVIDINVAENITVRDVHFVNNTGTNEVRVRNTGSHIRLIGNDSDSNCTNFATIEGAATDNFVVWTNTYTNAGGVVRTASGTNYSVANNLGMTA